MTLGLPTRFPLSRHVLAVAMIVVSTIGAAAPCAAVDLFVDPDQGSDSNSGMGPQSAWRHAPGDLRARARAARHQYAPGDRVLFKGGTEYSGRLHFPNVGNASLPIALRGDLWPDARGGHARLRLPRTGETMITAQMRAHIHIEGFVALGLRAGQALAFSFAPQGGVTSAAIFGADQTPLAIGVTHHQPGAALLLAGSTHLQPFDREPILLAAALEP